MSLPQRTTSLRPSRPLDATGLFWCLVLLFVAGISSLSEDKPTYLSYAFLLATPLAFGWQVWKWKKDLLIRKWAIEWCDRHYPNATDNSTLNFVLALAHDKQANLDTISPDSRLDDLNWTLDCDDFLFVDEANPHSFWIATLITDARIKGMKTKSVGGDTLDEVIRSLQTSTLRHDSGMHLNADGQQKPDSLPRSLPSSD